jgi:rRNA maturation protein Nop10
MEHLLNGQTVSFEVEYCFEVLDHPWPEGWDRKEHVLNAVVRPCIQDALDQLLAGMNAGHPATRSGKRVDYLVMIQRCRTERVSGVCDNCKYPLTCTLAHHCPECGHEIDIAIMATLYVEGKYSKRVKLLAVCKDGQRSFTIES